MQKIFSTGLIAGSVILLAAGIGRADIVITEVDAAGSANSAYGQDWFELTNTGGAAQDITGWKMDDNSDAFGTAVALRGISSIAAGQSVVFIEDGATATNDATLDAKFEALWFGSNIPSGLIVANYGGSGVGLSQTTDGVNIFDASGDQVTGVSFGASVLGQTFDNVAGLGASAPFGTTATDPNIATFSQTGVAGALASVNTPTEVGSPGSAVPEPASLGVLAFSAIAFLGRRRK